MDSNDCISPRFRAAFAAWRDMKRQTRMLHANVTSKFSRRTLTNMITTGLPNDRRLESSLGKLGRYIAPYTESGIRATIPMIASVVDAARRFNSAPLATVQWQI